MPTLAILLVIYYVAGALYQIARGPYYATYTEAKAILYLLLALVVFGVWLSLPFCGGIPVLAWVLIGTGWFFLALSFFGIGSRVLVGWANIGWAAFFAAVYSLILLTSTYC